jgi:hypothetical protein
MIDSRRAIEFGNVLELQSYLYYLILYLKLALIVKIQVLFP